VTYRLQVSWLPPSLAGLVIGTVFILPYVLFSATSGQLADKHDKARLMRWVKGLEIGIMGLAAFGLFTSSAAAMLACIFLLGVHSTLFGPVKYAYLPQHLNECELTGGNGMVEMGTFVAILLGNMAGGLLVAVPGAGPRWVALACLAVALLGRLAVQWVPASAPQDPQLAINWNPFSETWRNLKQAHGDPALFRSLLGISWMWFFGAVFLAQFPSFAKEVLHGDEHVASLLLAVFSVGIGLGSLMCEKLSHRHVDIGLVPLGALGMSAFAADLYFASHALPATTLQGVLQFVSQAAHWRVMTDLFLLALSAGLYSVPMYALIQLRARPSHRARIIGANNILNALFMVISALFAGALLAAGARVPEVFLATALANALVTGWVFVKVPEYLLRFASFVATRAFYRLRFAGIEHIPLQGPALLVCSHVDCADALLLVAASPRPICLVMDQKIFRLPILGWLFRQAGCVPIAPGQDDPQANAAAFEAADRVLAGGGLLAIFFEGAITCDGEMPGSKSGLMKILQRRPVPVVPMALQNRGSFFSRDAGRTWTRPLQRGAFACIHFRIGAPVPAEKVDPESMRSLVQQLWETPIHPFD
jgi:1-acyl-sn-glycerol-3-phosphate acyltransferase